MTEAADLVEGDLESAIRALKAERDGEYFAGPRPPLRLVSNDLMGEDVVRLIYVPR